eukprot:CAMPEP_0115445462 /NCGR_PEP_ID=MMETSP0271-20121206/38928_1 /TAXON_ID=71861 /ORGANISM="Scrippsiella trochoidea, Strain CCMP3099" /LENGTH=346 /DNA_ID=CAMNT_0002871433 /DNA_START=51 /DNA_END=1092 /DNA_ORIENTATION=-
MSSTQGPMNSETHQSIWRGLSSRYHPRSIAEPNIVGAVKFSREACASPKQKVALTPLWQVRDAHGLGSQTFEFRAADCWMKRAASWTPPSTAAACKQARRSRVAAVATTRELLRPTAKAEFQATLRELERCRQHHLKTLRLHLLNTEAPQCLSQRHFHLHHRKGAADARPSPVAEDREGGVGYAWGQFVRRHGVADALVLALAFDEALWAELVGVCTPNARAPLERCAVHSDIDALSNTETTREHDVIGELAGYGTGDWWPKAQRLGDDCAQVWQIFDKLPFQRSCGKLLVQFALDLWVSRQKEEDRGQRIGSRGDTGAKEGIHIVHQLVLIQLASIVVARMHQHR